MLASPWSAILDEAPWVSRIAGRHGVEIGGFTVAPGGKRVVVVATLDNLLKGAATQAMQNLNLAFGFDEFTSIPLEENDGMSDLLWQKPGVAVDARIQKFLAGDDVILDREFFLHDIAASKAHAEGLQRIGILTADELAGLQRELAALADDFRSGAFVLDERFEDWPFRHRGAPDRTPGRCRPQDPHRPQPQRPDAGGDAAVAEGKARARRRR